MFTIASFYYNYRNSFRLSFLVYILNYQWSLNNNSPNNMKEKQKKLDYSCSCK